MRKAFPFITALVLAALTLVAAPPASAAAPQAVTVEIRGMQYAQKVLTIAPGTTVTWVNKDEMPHTVTNRGRVFGSAALDTGESFSYTFATPGEFTYFCALHPFMIAKVVVTTADPSP